MAYRNTLQADALKLVAQKLQSSLAVEGELPEDGLAFYGDSGDDLMMALARKLVAGETDHQPVEDIFRQTQEIAAQANQLLVDADWEQAEPDSPLVVDAQVVETLPIAVVPCEPHTGHAERQSRFSWAEFLSDKQTPTKRRGREPAQPSASLFDWALEREQQASLAAACGGLPLLHVWRSFFVPAPVVNGTSVTLDLTSSRPLCPQPDLHRPWPRSSVCPERRPGRCQR